MSDVAWAEIGYAGWRRVARVDAGDAVVVEGPCPRCEHDTTFRIERGLPGGPGSKDLPTELVGASPATIICSCGYPHDKRPDGSSEVGCGAYWYDQPADE